jgi:hypothetical protein
MYIVYQKQSKKNSHITQSLTYHRAIGIMKTGLRLWTGAELMLAIYLYYKLFIKTNSTAPAARGTNQY